MTGIGFLLLAKDYLSSCVPQVAMYIAFFERVIPVSAGIAEDLLEKHALDMIPHQLATPSY